MPISKVVATFQARFETTGLPGNLLLITTIVLEKRFHVMWYVLLASLAVSDFLWLALVNTFRTASILKERWLFGQTMCYLNPCLSRYLHINTVLHLVRVVSYDRYQAIVKSPLTYSGVVTYNRVALIVLIWIIPIPLSIGPFLDWGKYVYIPEVFYRVFSLTWQASMQIYWNKRKRLHKKKVQLPQDWFWTPTWPPFYCSGTPVWPPWRHVKTLYCEQQWSRVVRAQKMKYAIPILLYLCGTISSHYIVKSIGLQDGQTSDKRLKDSRILWRHQTPAARDVKAGKRT